MLIDKDALLVLQSLLTTRQQSGASCSRHSRRYAQHMHKHAGCAVSCSLLALACV